MDVHLVVILFWFNFNWKSVIQRQGGVLVPHHNRQSRRNVPVRLDKNVVEQS
jgi:hypothetical protein